MPPEVNNFSRNFDSLHLCAPLPQDVLAFLETFVVLKLSREFYDTSSLNWKYLSP